MNSQTKPSNISGEMFLIFLVVLVFLFYGLGYATLSIFETVPSWLPVSSEPIDPLIAIAAGVGVTVVCVGLVTLVAIAARAHSRRRISREWRRGFFERHPDMLQHYRTIEAIVARINKDTPQARTSFSRVAVALRDQLYSLSTGDESWHLGQFSQRVFTLYLELTEKRG